MICLGFFLHLSEMEGKINALGQCRLTFIISMYLLKIWVICWRELVKNMLKEGTSLCWIEWVSMKLSLCWSVTLSDSHTAFLPLAPQFDNMYNAAFVQLALKRENLIIKHFKIFALNFSFHSLGQVSNLKYMMWNYPNLIFFYFLAR